MFWDTDNLRPYKLHCKQRFAGNGLTLNIIARAPISGNRVTNIANHTLETQTWFSNVFYYQIEEKSMSQSLEVCCASVSGNFCNTHHTFTDRAWKTKSTVHVFLDLFALIITALTGVFNLLHDYCKAFWGIILEDICLGEQSFNHLDAQKWGMEIYLKKNNFSMQST